MTKIYLLLLALLSAMRVDGQAVVLDGSTSLPIDISRQAAGYTDTTAGLSLREVRDMDFRPVESTNFLVSFSNDTHWYRFTLKNEGTRAGQWFIEWENPIGELIECYIPERGKGHSTSEGAYQVTRAGSLVALSDREYLGEMPYFRVDIEAGREKTVYLRVKSQRGMRVALQLHDSASLYATRLANNTRTGFASGMVFLRLFFVILLAIFAIREATFKAYSFMLVLRSLAYWGIIGVLASTFTDQPVVVTRLNFLVCHLLPIGYVVAAWYLLPIGRLPGMVRYTLFGIVAAVLLLGGIIMFDYRWYWLLASQYLVLASQCFVFGLYLYALWQRWSVNWYYSIPFLLGIGSYFFLVLGVVGILNAPWVFGLVYLLFVSEIFIFGLFLGKIIIDYRRERETAKRELIFQEEQSTRLQELDTLKTNFFANVSHEFRTPLTLLVGPLEDFRLQNPANGLIPAMQRNVRRLQSLIDQLLDLSRLEAGHMRPAMVRADLPTFLRQLFASFESLAQSRNIFFNHQQNAVSREACFDPDKLEKIVSNLLSNAFKFTPEGGRVTVQADYTDTGLSLQIRDYGIGIDAARLPHIFDRFYRIETANEPHDEGTGIGLALVRELTKALRGEIEVESEPGRGTTFSLRIPTDAETWAEHLTEDSDGWSPIQPPLEPPAVFSIEANERSDHEADKPLLLIVEDNPDLRAYIHGIFQEKYRIVEGHDGQDGLERAFTEIPDLVVCDVMMPRLDGFGFCEKLKSDPRTSHIPVVMLTAKATREDRLAGLELGADDYLIKPFDRAELQLRVHNLLKQREMLRQKYSQQIAEATTAGQGSSARTLDEKFLEKAILIVREQGGDSQFGVDHLCAALNVSRSNLHRKLKALTDQSTTQFIRSIRLYRAAELLKQPGVSVSGVAYEVGFESVSYFSKSFSQQMGVAPSDWALSDKV